MTSPKQPFFHSLHHTAIRTRNIEIAIQFYSLFGFQVESKFRAGPARAAWLATTTTTTNHQNRIELIEVPPYLLNEPPDSKTRALDLLRRETLLGWNHVALDVTPFTNNTNGGLNDYIEELNAKSLAIFQKTLRIGLEPRQQIIGKYVYELAFLYDADGSLVELLNRVSELEEEVGDGWVPWDGKGFRGGGNEER